MMYCSFQYLQRTVSLQIHMITLSGKLNLKIMIQARLF